MNNEMNNMNNVNPNPTGTPGNLNPANPNPVPPVETINPAPQPNIPNVGTPVPPVPNPGLNVEPQAQGPVEAPINLNPAGVVPETPTMVNNTTEPLQATSLNSETILNPTPPQDPNMMPNNGAGIPPVPPMNNNNIGMMGGVPTPPPMPEEPKKGGKKKMNMPLLIILAVVLVAAIGFGVYYFLVLSKTNTPTASIRPKFTEVELGSEIGETPADYVTVTGVALSTCTLDTNLDPMTVGTYEFTVTCGNINKTGTVKVEDTKAPTVTPKNLVVAPGVEVMPEDFIASYDDYSEVTFEFAEEVDTSAVGEYKVSVIASDEYDNAITVEANLTVSENAPVEYLYCTREEETDQQALATAEYRFGITNDGSIYESTEKVITYKFADEEGYNAAVTEIDEDGSLDGYEANISMDADNLTITITIANMTADNLAADFNLDTFPTVDADVEGLFSGTCEYVD